ncbi:MAG TPA: TraR/DksA family transcriptional regulator [Candidatus Binatia bacterium]
MIAYKTDKCYEKLQKRQGEITRTLEHVQKERRTVEENKKWIDKAAYQSRCHLLDRLADWYLKETTIIQQALMRISEGRYGICVACREPIEPQRLETAPEAEFCAQCQKLRESVIQRVA